MLKGLCRLIKDNEFTETSVATTFYRFIMKANQNLSFRKYQTIN
jgi:hypothetical protein